MTLIVLIICITIYALFGSYMAASAEMLYQKAHEKELANLEKEFGTHEEEY